MTNHPLGRVGALALVLAALAGSSRIASAQIVNPAEARPRPDQEHPQGQDEESGHLRSWELPPTIVTAEPLGKLREEDRVGPYGQPRWTAHRRFPTTRVYVRPPGTIELEHWTRVKAPRDGKTTVENQYEIEFGLPNRFQIDLYLATEKTGSEGTLDVSEQKFEVRYALADWGVIPANPTLYFEWASRDAAPDKMEAKLLLGDELAEGWHWGSNLVLEHEVSGALENEYGLTLGVSHTLSDEKFSLGAEVKTAYADEHQSRGDYSKEFEIGPTLQYRPFPAMHVDIAPLIGIGPDSRSLDLFVVLGWEL